MAETSGISWTHHTASPWFGCTEVSPGCVNCYARELTLQHQWAGWGDKSPRIRSKGFWKDVYKWNKKAEGLDYRPRIFTSLMDWLDPIAPIAWFTDFMKVVSECSNLDWLLLTKRPELWKQRLKDASDHIELDPILDQDIDTYDFIWAWLEGKSFRHIWMGTTVEDQARADERIPLLLEIPSRIRWLSVEPLLEDVDLALSGIIPKDISPQYQPLSQMLHWVVVGGESGSKRRDCGVDSIVSVVNQCLCDNVPVWVKQDCALRPGQQGRLPDETFNLKQLPT